MRPSITERQEQNLRLLYDPASGPPGYWLGRGDKDAIGAALAELGRLRAENEALLADLAAARGREAKPLFDREANS